MTTKKKAPNPKKKGSAHKPKRPASDECFTIMPFGGWFDEYYTEIFCPAIRGAGLVPKRADDLYRPSAIVHDIWSYTRRCRLILADLTGKNPNVFYELGLAHAIAKPAILVTESINDVPFDLRALRVIEYDKNSPVWGEALREKIQTAIGEVLASPLQSVLPSFLEVEHVPRAPITEHQKELIEIKQELDLLRRELRRRSSLSPRDEIGPEEAANLIERYLRDGLPHSAIVRRVSALGAPADWVEKKIVELIPRPSRSRPPSKMAQDVSDSQKSDPSGIGTTSAS